MNTILITGTSRGIGKATAEEFLDRSWNVIGTSTSHETPIQHANYQHVQLNFKDKKESLSIIQSLKKQSFDCIINNAAILLEDRASSQIECQQLSSTLDINLMGPIQIIENLLSTMNPTGTIINISSNWGSFSDPNFQAYLPHYKISKAALNMYTKLLAARLPEFTVIAFDPGWVKTDMGGETATKEPSVVAKDLVYLASNKVSSGVFYQGTSIRDW